MILQILAFTLTAVTATIAYSWQTSIPYIYKVAANTLITGLVAISATQTLRRVRRTFMMSTYLRIEIEPDLPNIKWETDLYFYRINRKRQKDKKRSFFRLNRKKNKADKQSLRDFQQAAVLLAYRYILLVTVAFTGFYTYGLYAELAKKFVIFWQFNINWQNIADEQLNMALFCLLLSIGLGVYIFWEGYKLSEQVNGKIEKIWKEAIRERKSQ